MAEESAGKLEVKDVGNLEINDVPRVPLKDPPPREVSAKEIAGKIINAFQVVLYGALVLSFTSLGICAWVTRDLESTIKLAKEGILPLLAGCASFVTTIFGSLLAFILGHYFKNEK